MVRYHDQYCSRRTILWKSQLVNLKDGIDFVMSFAIRESRRTSDDSPFVVVVGLFVYSRTMSLNALIPPIGYFNL